MLGTGTPAPATMKEAQVETLTEPEPSPRCDHVDGIRGCLTAAFAAHRRHRTGNLVDGFAADLSAISNPPICEGVARRTSCCQRQMPLSSRDSVARWRLFR